MYLHEYNMFNALLKTSDADVVSTLSYLLKNRRIHTGHQNSECIKRVMFGLIPVFHSFKAELLSSKICVFCVQSCEVIAA